jgi:two-component system KDP operon response regulator KdpE
MDSINIILIGDEPNILRTLRRNLISRGYNVNIAFDGEEAINMAEKLNPDLLILNLDFTNFKIDGLKICAQLRHICQCPMIVLSTIGSEEVKIKALDLGADDYLVMPFNMDEFLARTRSTLRRWMLYKGGNKQTSNIIAVNDLVINKDSRQVTIRGEIIKLTKTEYELLLYLAERSGKVVTHRELLRAIWGPEYGEEREYLRVFISQLRHKIEDDPLNPMYILTEPAIGYRFIS